MYTSSTRNIPFQDLEDLGGSRDARTLESFVEENDAAHVASCVFAQETAFDQWYIEYPVSSEAALDFEQLQCVAEERANSASLMDIRFELPKKAKVTTTG